MKIGLLFLLFMIGASACHPIENDASAKGNIGNLDSLKGTWTLKYVFLGDVIDQPCSSSKMSHDITLNITNQLVDNTTDTFVINGKSAVNSIFGGLKILSFDENTQIGKAAITQLGSTKMAGPEDLMNCELRYFTLLNATKDFKIFKDTDGKTYLHLGDFKTDNQPSRNGGRYLIYIKN
ncbi:META domain-containing protein [Flectobacillus roseus]|uniref:META domain-containing protein n=1 Tax=Flectobacillus roseus TaxID=502259 RepID=UPI0024B6E06F|nr:META domain-containing protein [Flectobacillus roseus]MDI9869124.1 META domain-containing protein [Flectobacillus roseus]